MRINTSETREEFQARKKQRYLEQYIISLNGAAVNRACSFLMDLNLFLFQANNKEMVGQIETLPCSSQHSCKHIQDSTS